MASIQNKFELEFNYIFKEFEKDIISPKNNDQRMGRLNLAFPKSKTLAKRNRALFTHLTSMMLGIFFAFFFTFTEQILFVFLMLIFYFLGYIAFWFFLILNIRKSLLSFRELDKNIIENIKKSIELNYSNFFCGLMNRGINSQGAILNYVERSLKQLIYQLESRRLHLLLVLYYLF